MPFALNASAKPSATNMIPMFSIVLYASSFFKSLWIVAESMPSMAVIAPSVSVGMLHQNSGGPSKSKTMRMKP